MKRIHSLLATLALGALVTAPIHAQATRTWVSGVGDDANPCSRTAPCKTFAGAISKTATNGEISVLDPGGFGAVTITKAITISGDGTLAGILSAGTNGIIVNAPATADVIIRNISINGAGTGLNGIRFLAGRSLTVDNVTISNFTTRGIDISTTAQSKLIVRNTRITSGVTGIFVNTTAGLALAMLDGVKLQQLTNGIEVQNGRVMASDCVFSGNTANGILLSAAGAVANIEGSQIAFNDIAGVNASVSGATARLSNNEIYNNTSGVTIAVGAFVASPGGNRVAGNGGSTNANQVLPTN